MEALSAMSVLCTAVGDQPSKWVVVALHQHCPVTCDDDKSHKQQNTSFAMCCSSSPCEEKTTEKEIWSKSRLRRQHDHGSFAIICRELSINSNQKDSRIILIITALYLP